MKELKFFKLKEKNQNLTQKNSKNKGGKFNSCERCVGDDAQDETAV